MTEYETKKFNTKKEAMTKWNKDKCIFWDVEANDWSNPLLVGVVEPDGTYREFSDDPIKQFGRYAMQSKFRSYRFIAHNAGSYDHGFLLRYLLQYSSREYDFEILETNGDLFYIRIEDRHGKYRHFQDSIKLMPRSLDELADSFADTPKLTSCNININDLPPALEDLDAGDRQELSKYLRHDVQALKECVESFTRIIRDLTDGKTGPQLTVASTAMGVYQTYFMEREDVSNMGVPQASPELEEIIRESYYGGRTEVFRHRAYEHEGPYNHYDVNSLFPYCYTKKKLPTGKPHYVKDASNDILDKDEFGGFVKLSGVISDTVDIPVLPNRYKPIDANSEKVLFPVGPVEGWYSMREVRYAREIGQFEDLEIDEAIISGLDYMFKQYGSELYGMKQDINKDKNPGRYKIVKFLLNSLYGKFGMDRNQSKVVRMDPTSEDFPPDKETVGNNRDMRAQTFDNGLFKEPDVVEADYIIPRIASAITAEARIQMHKWMMQIKKLGGRCYYCDTDSIVTDIQLPEEDVTDELGKMDHEKTVQKAVFCRPKTYAEISENENTVKGKGMRDIDTDTPHNDPVTAEAMIQAFDNDAPEDINSSWYGPEGLKQSLKKQSGGVTTKHYSRSLSGWDDKRQHIDDDNSIPLDMGELWRRKTNKEQAEHRRKRKNAMLRTGFGAPPERESFGNVSDSRAEYDSTLSASENKVQAHNRHKDKMIDAKLKRQMRE